jgi:hypothetical protein
METQTLPRDYATTLARRRAMRRDQQAAALGFVLDATAELLGAMRKAGVGSDKHRASVRALRREASEKLDTLEASQ